ncbi:TPA: hypothetical protein ACYZY5_001045 [Escherichia coli]|nr:hypothetical protein [Escherichia coli]APJ68196.1 hypothetical protein RG26_18605 [Escherichia coli]APL87480.1 hypothetical protein RG29_24130 [Escherichia coli]EEV6997460.1 hypothetical protein [Escherichia coli]SQL84922.1 Uncharacterised protein [Escherichia coli]HAM9003018.1 hypothetical protein [Escherichia coli]
MNREKTFPEMLEEAAINSLAIADTKELMTFTKRQISAIMQMPSISEEPATAHAMAIHTLTMATYLWLYSDFGLQPVDADDRELFAVDVDAVHAVLMPLNVLVGWIYHNSVEEVCRAKAGNPGGTDWRLLFRQMTLEQIIDDKYGLSHDIADALYEAMKEGATAALNGNLAAPTIH